MSKQGFNELVTFDIADGTQVLNTTTRTVIVPDYTFSPGDPRIYPGAVWRVQCYFDFSVTATATTMTFDLRWGGSAGTVLATTAAFANKAAVASTRAGFLEFVTTWRTVGAAGSAYTMGRMLLGNMDDTSVALLKAQADMLVFPSAPAVVGSLDTTTSKALSVCVTFNQAVATTQLTNHLRILEMLN